MRRTSAPCAYFLAYRKIASNEFIRFLLWGLKQPKLSTTNRDRAHLHPPPGSPLHQHTPLPVEKTNTIRTNMHIPQISITSVRQHQILQPAAAASQACRNCHHTATTFFVYKPIELRAALFSQYCYGGRQQSGPTIYTKNCILCYCYKYPTFGPDYNVYVFP